jgi:hypothetical protein
MSPHISMTHATNSRHTFKQLSHHSSTVCIPAQEIGVKCWQTGSYSLVYVSVSVKSLASQVLLDSKEMELVGFEIEPEHLVVHNPPTIVP